MKTKSDSSDSNPIKKNKMDKVWPYIFVMPGILLFICFVFIPLVQTIGYSFTDWSGLGEKNFVGFSNYIDFFKDKTVLISFRNNIIWAIVACTVPIGIGLIQANLLVNGGIKHSNVFQLILFLPQILSSVIVSVIWTWLYSPSLGPINKFLEMVGLDQWTHSWLGEPEIVMIALLIMFVWMAYGFNTVVYSAAIQGIDPSLYEAATLDGASSFQCFTKITVPSLQKTTTTLLLFALIDSFKVFDIVFQMTKGGPGYSSHVISYHLYSEAFSKNHVGYGSTIAVMLTILVLILSKLFLGAREKNET